MDVPLLLPFCLDAIPEPHLCIFLVEGRFTVYRQKPDNRLAGQDWNALAIGNPPAGADNRFWRFRSAEGVGRGDLAAAPDPGAQRIMRTTQADLPTR